MLRVPRPPHRVAVSSTRTTRNLSILHATSPGNPPLAVTLNFEFPECQENELGKAVCEFASESCQPRTGPPPFVAGPRLSCSGRHCHLVAFVAVARCGAAGRCR